MTVRDLSNPSSRRLRRVKMGERELRDFGVAVESVMSHGAVGDGTTDDSAAIQSAIDAAAALDVSGAVFFPAGKTFYVATGLILPGVAPHPGKQLHLFGRGAKITTDQAITIIGRDLPADSNDSVGRTRYKFTIEGLHLKGTQLAGQKGISISATYGMTIRDVRVEQMATGIELIYTMMTRVESCFITDTTEYGYVVRSGSDVTPNPLWTGATVNNSGSNHTVLTSCHVSCVAGMEAAFNVRSSSGVIIENCISEGANPVHGVKYDAEYATVTKFFQVSNLHSENSPTGSVVFLDSSSSGHMVVEGLWHQTQNVVLVEDGSNASASTVNVVRNLPYIPTGCQFKRNTAAGPMWLFDQSSPGLNDNLCDASFWVGGLVPNNVQQQGHGGNSAWQIVTEELHVRGHLRIQDAKQFITSTGTVSINGQMQLAENIHMQVGTTTGTQIATAAAQKLGFYGTTPAVQPSLTHSRTGETTPEAQLRQALAALGLVADNTTA